jgi:Protein of unknown function (DUF998)
MTQRTMPVHDAGTTAGHGGVPSPTATSTTRRLLACGVAAAPLFVVVALAQALTRPGFDLTRDAVSLLTIGRLGWIQVANFLVTGLLMIACAAGTRRVLHGGPGGRWIPALLYACGAGLLGGGVFHPDPSGGFPPGTPSSSAVSSWHGMLHMVSGSTAFLALIAVCFVIGHRFGAGGQRRWAVASRVSGALFAAGLAASGAPGGSLTLFMGVSIALIWVALAAGRLIAERHA